MKLLASALSLVLVGLTGIWLWFDATADARQDLPGVVVSADLDPREPAVRQAAIDDAGAGPTGAGSPGTTSQDRAPTTSGDPAGPAEEERATFDTRLVALSSVMGSLRASLDELKELADEAGKTVEAERAPAAPAPLPPPPPVPQPVQPAPVTPPGMCWDDDEWEECDDDWDDDDWDDDWDDD